MPTPASPVYTQEYLITRPLFSGRVFYYNNAVTTSWSALDSTPCILKSEETLLEVIRRLHRRQKFYKTHKHELPNW
mgnify:CR=1 FL=1